MIWYKIWREGGAQKINAIMYNTNSLTELQYFITVNLDKKFCMIKQEDGSRLSALLRNYDRQTDRPTDRPGHREVALVT